MNSTTNKTDVMRLARYVAVRLIAFSVIAGIGMGLMYFADNYRHMITLGVFYLILMCAMILVATADEIESRIRKRLTAKT